jgi:hypothetical protein
LYKDGVANRPIFAPPQGAGRGSDRCGWRGAGAQECNISSLKAAPGAAATTADTSLYMESTADRSRHAPRAAISAGVGTVVAGAVWWTMIAFTNPALRWHSASGILRLLQSVCLFGVTTYAPNLIGLRMLDRWIAARSTRARTVRRGAWLVLGVAYGLVLLAAGIAVGVVVIGGTMLAFAPKALWPGLVGTLLTIHQLYPVAVIAGIASVGSLVVQTSSRDR